jgi:hypothetical protein
VFLLQTCIAAQQVNSAVLGRGHEPRAGILRDAGAGPLLKSGDERILCQLFGDANVTHDASETGDDAGGFHAPDGIDGAIDLAAVDFCGGHDWFHRIDESIFRHAGANDTATPSSVRDRSLVHRSDFELGFHIFALAGGAALHPCDRLFPRSDLEDVDACDELAGLREGAVHGVRFAAADMKTRGVCAGLQPLDGDEDTGPAHLVVVALHGGYKLGIRRRPGLHPLLGFT